MADLPFSKLSTETADLFDPPPVAHARATDRQTSHEAARSVSDLTAKQEAVLHCLRAIGPACDVEWIDHYQRVDIYPRQSVSGLRSRRSELEGVQRVVADGTRKIGRRNHTVWRAL